MVMSVVRQLETKVAGWLKPVPPLPINAQKWLAENVWWLAIISVVVSVIGMFILFSAIMAYLAFLGAAIGIYSAQTYASGWIVATLLSLVFSIVTTILTALAINPLKKSQKKGWDLLFLTMLVSAASILVGAVVGLDLGRFIGGIIFGGVGLAIGAYFLFQIRSYFVKTTKETRPFTPSAVK